MSGMAKANKFGPTVHFIKASGNMEEFKAMELSITNPETLTMEISNKTWLRVMEFLLAKTGKYTMVIGTKIRNKDLAKNIILMAADLKENSLMGEGSDLES